MCRSLTKKDKKEIMDFITNHWILCRDKIEDLYNHSSNLKSTELNRFLLRLTNYDDILTRICHSIETLESSLDSEMCSMDLYQHIKVIINSIKFVLLDIEDDYQPRLKQIEH